MCTIRDVTKPWRTRFQTIGSLGGIPRLDCVAGETQNAPAYRHAGRLRAGQTYVVFQYTLRGVGTFKDDRGEHATPPGAGFLCEVGDPLIEYYYPPAATEPWTFAWLTFDGDWAVQWARDLARAHGHVFELPQKTGIIERVCSFQSETQGHRVIQADWGAEFVLSLLLALTRVHEAGKTATDAGGLVRRAQVLVANHLDRNINGKQIASLLRVSREHLSRVFHQTTGGTFHDYLLKQKIEYACHLLRHTDASAKEVASQLGYDSPAQFGRTFLRLTGTTPCDFRAQERLL